MTTIIAVLFCSGCIGLWMWKLFGEEDKEAQTTAKDSPPETPRCSCGLHGSRERLWVINDVVVRHEWYCDGCSLEVTDLAGEWADEGVNDECE